jgi:hypothetical protein
MSTVTAGSATGTSRFREVAVDRAAEFEARGYRRRYFFPHRIYHLPKCGPDGYKLVARMRGGGPLDRVWEIVIQGDPSLLGEFPGDLFFDRDVMWHEQHFGMPGQVACATALVEEGRVWSFAHHSDLVQRIGRRRAHKTRIDTLFRGWPRMLVNALLHFARERGAIQLRTPTSELAMRNTDPARTVEPELFQRVYDRSLRHLDGVTAEDGWWVVDLPRNHDRIAEPDERTSPAAPAGRVVCLCHDVERGMGHLQVDPGFARDAERSADGSLDSMLGVEAELGVRGTYHVLGTFLPEVRERIEQGGHCLAFHSYDHGDGDQLGPCREVDYRIKGYRPARSLIGPAVSDERLAHHNFEWVASGEPSLGIEQPVMRNGIVRIPVNFDDFPLYNEPRDYDQWEERLLELVEERSIMVLCLHDCYAPFWLQRYGDLIEKLKAGATFRTLDQVAAHVTLASAA